MGSWCKRPFKREGEILLWRSRCTLLGWPQAVPVNSSEAAMAISAVHHMYLDSKPVQTERQKTPPHSGADPGRVQNLSSKQENKQDPVQEPALLQPGVSRGGRRSSRGGGDGLWARFKTGRCWWKPTKRRVRASDTDLRDFVRVTTGCAGTASLLLKRASPPRTETFHEAKARASGQHPREDFISPTHPPLSQPNFVIQWTKGNFTLTGYFLSFSKAVADW